MVITKNVRDVTIEEAFDMIHDNKDNEDFTVIDVRTPEEFSRKHIENAVNMDFHSDTFKEEIDSLPKEKSYLLYCGSGKRSGKTKEMMEELGFDNVFNMKGGILSYTEKGYEVV